MDAPTKRYRLTTNEFHYILLENPDADPDANPSGLDYGAALVKMGHVGLGGNNGRAAIVEGNRIYHCAIGGPYQDTWSTRDCIVRNNYYHDVISGPTQSYIGSSVSFWTDGILLASLDHDGSTAIATTSKPHGLVALTDTVVILSDISQDPSPYNGTFPVTDVPDSKTFKYGPLTGTLMVRDRRPNTALLQRAQTCDRWIP